VNAAVLVQAQELQILNSLNYLFTCLAQDLTGEANSELSDLAALMEACPSEPAGAWPAHAAEVRRLKHQLRYGNRQDAIIGICRLAHDLWGNLMVRARS
jgi:hypothetical protein